MKEHCSYLQQGMKPSFLVLRSQMGQLFLSLLELQFAIGTVSHKSNTNYPDTGPDKMPSSFVSHVIA
jgi:hypothetical protein